MEWEYQWLIDNFSPQALEAATWYAAWIGHRNKWLGYDEWKLPGCDLTVSERLGRKNFTALQEWPGRFDPNRPGLSNDDGRDDLESPESDPSRLPLRASQEERPRGRDQIAEAAQQHQRFKTRIEYYDSGLVVRRRIPEGERGENPVYRKGHPKEGQRYKFDAREMLGRPNAGPFPPRNPFRPPHAPPPTEDDIPCPGCPGGCDVRKCELRERIRIDETALRLILRGAHDPLGSNLRRRRMLLDGFALEGQFPAPSEAVRLEEILMKLHQYFRDAPSRADWDSTYKPQASPLSVAERMALCAKQSPLTKPGAVILYVAKTEGLDLNQLAGVQAASQAAAVGTELIRDTSSGAPPAKPDELPYFTNL